MFRNSDKNSPRSSFCNPVPLPSRRSSPSSSLLLREPLKGPDLAIYSQYPFLHKPFTSEIGTQHLWENPDIWTWLPNPGQPQSKLRQQILVNVHNVGEVAAIGTEVQCFTSIFGLGTTKTHLATKYIQVIPAGGTVQIGFPLSQEILAGEQRIGVHIVIKHPNDANTENNRGSQVSYGIYTSGQSRGNGTREIPLRFPIKNDTLSQRTIRLDTYPQLISNLPNITLDSGQQTEVELTIEVPDTLHGTPQHPGELDMTVFALERIDQTELLMDGFHIRILADD